MVCTCTMLCIKVYIPKFGVSKLVHLLSFCSCLSHTCSCSLIWQRSRVNQRPISLDCTVVWTKSLFFFVYQGCCNYFHFWALHLSQFFLDQRFFCVCERFFPLGYSWPHILKPCTVWYTIMFLLAHPHRRIQHRGTCAPFLAGYVHKLL